MASITIHRGAGQIGGSVTEIRTGTTRILIDCGSELPGSRGKVRDEDIIRLMERRPFDAVLFTHYHGDHVGLMGRIPADIPIYMDDAMKRILTTLHGYTRDEAMNGLLKGEGGRLHTFVPPEPFTVGDMRITPFFADHSAYRANMFLIEAEGRTIFVSGDFRSKGYLGKSLGKIPEILRKNRKSVDVLLCEGTMMSRFVDDERLMDERTLQRRVGEFLKTHRQAYVICSSTNFDTITSIYHAAQRNGIGVYAKDHIRALTRTFSEIASAYTPLYDLRGIKDQNRLAADGGNGFVLFLGTGLSWVPDRERLPGFRGEGKEEPWLIYSMWKGYLDPASPAYNGKLAAFVSGFGDHVLSIHTAGHADRGTLARFIDSLGPRKYILPFHTENAEGFRTLDIEDRYRDRIRMMRDGETLEIP